MDIEPEVLKRSIESLLRLQEIDAQLFQLNTEEKTPSVEYASLQAKVADFKKAFLSAERIHRDLDRERRALELRTLTLQEDIKRAEARRRDVRNTKEEFAAGKEFDVAQKKLAETKKSMEDKATLLAQKQEIKDQKQKDLQEAEAKFQELDQQRQKRILEIQEEKKKWMAQRDAYIAQVDEMVFSMYERVQKLRKGNGIAIVSGLVCGGCHVSIPPHTRHRLDKLQEIITCPSCSRILFPESELQNSQEQSLKTSQA